MGTETAKSIGEDPGEGRLQEGRSSSPPGGRRETSCPWAYELRSGRIQYSSFPLLFIVLDLLGVVLFSLSVLVCFPSPCLPSCWSLLEAVARQEENWRWQISGRDPKVCSQRFFFSFDPNNCLFDLSADFDCSVALEANG
ncbi:hypothetical protein FKM82_028391 [Ascaphus truei]